MKKVIDNERVKIIKKSSILGILGNLFLLVIKLIFGIISGSQAMIADSLHSGEDMLSCVVSYIGARVSSKKIDERHPFGYGKAEYIFSFVISLLMIVASFTMVINSIDSIVNIQSIRFSYWLVGVCFITISIKLLLYFYTNKKYKQTASILIKASKEDHRNDIFVTTSTLIGIIASRFGITYLDPIFGLLISAWIGIVGIKILINSYIVLIDTGIEKNKISEIRELVRVHEEVLNIDNIKSKPIGDKFLIILKISMNGDQTLSTTHNLGNRIKREIMDKYSYVYDVVVHINPYIK